MTSEETYRTYNLSSMLLGTRQFKNKFGDTKENRIGLKRQCRELDGFREPEL